MICKDCHIDLTRRPHVTVTHREYRFAEGNVTLTDYYCMPCATRMREGEKAARPNEGHAHAQPA